MEADNHEPPTFPYIELVISTWTKDSHGLYDYDTSEANYQVTKSILDVNSKIYKEMPSSYDRLTSCDTYIKANSDRKKVNSDHQLVAEFVRGRSKKKPNFKVRPGSSNCDPGLIDIQKTPFIVIRRTNQEEPEEKHKLKPGNIIKIGRVGFMVIEMKTDKLQQFKDTSHFQETSGILEIDKTAKSTEQNSPQKLNSACKVCLCEEEEEQNPLISPCMCKGSCSLIHVACLQKWINSKVKREVNGIVTSFNFTKFQCEICKYPFPRIVKMKGKEEEMMSISKPDKPYVILESLSHNIDQREKEQKTLHLISTDETIPIKIGRGHNCQVRMTDISVSRSHAEIVYQKNNFYIKDTKSKFGTLIKLDEEIRLKENKFLKLQFGRTLYTFKVCGEIGEIDTE